MERKDDAEASFKRSFFGSLVFVGFFELTVSSEQRFSVFLFESLATRLCLGPDQFSLGCKHSISRVREALLGAVVQQLELLVLVSGSSEDVEDTITVVRHLALMDVSISPVLEKDNQKRFLDTLFVRFEHFQLWNDVHKS